MDFIHTLLTVLFVIGAAPTILGILVLVILEPQPRGLLDHLRGAARYLIAGGALFHLARAVAGHAPRWEIAALMLGLGFAMGIHAWDQHLLAKLQEKLSAADGQQSGT